MKNICEYKDCTGCSLCAVNCPKSCISMSVVDNFGHLYPRINQDSCIDCGLCRKNCPAINPLEKKSPITSFAAWAKDEEDYKSSTSGAAASVLSRFILDMGGVVYGCSMLENVNVQHIRIDKTEDLYRLKGSKYVQSNIQECIPLLKQDIKNGKSVLFVGTPCQVAAVKKLYKLVPEKLYLVDIICHGTPSLKFLQENVEKKVGAINVNKVVFRKGNTMCLAVTSNDSEVYSIDLKRNRFRDLYLNPFFDGYSYKDACYHCQYACAERISDITIGDFWGLGKLYPADMIPEHKNGCSLMLPSTDKGLSLIKAISEKMNIFERPVDEAVKGNYQLQRPYRLDWRRKLYRQFVKKINFRQIYYLCTLDLLIKYKIRTKVRK